MRRRQRDRLAREPIIDREPIIRGSRRTTARRRRGRAKTRPDRPDGREAPSATARRGDRPAERRRAAGDRPAARRRSAASRCRTSSSTARPGLGKTTFATVLHNELGVELNMTSGPALDKKMDVMPYLTNAAEGLDPVHRRDPPPAQDGRGVHLPGDGGLPGRRRPGRGDVGPDDQPAAEEVHDHRRHDPQRHALRPAPRPVPHARAPGVLRRRRPRPDRHRSTPSKLRTTITPDAAWELAQRSRGTPRLANARLRWVRDYATARADGHITLSDRPRCPRHAGGRRRGDGQAGPPLPGDPDPASSTAARPAPRRSPRR